MRAATGASAVVGSAVYAAQIMIGLALVDEAGLSIFVGGLVLAPACLLSGWLALRVGRLRTSRAITRVCAGAASVVLAGTAAGVLGALLKSDGLVILAASHAVLGLGAAATCVSTAAVVSAGADVGRVTSLNQVARQGGGAAGAALDGLCIGHNLSTTSLAAGWSLVAVAAAVILLFAVPLGRTLSATS